MKIGLIVLLLFGLSYSYGQDGSGRVESKDGEALIGAHLLFYKNGRIIGTTLSDTNGGFVYSTALDSVKASYIGYEDGTAIIIGQENLVFSLQPKILFEVSPVISSSALTRTIQESFVLPIDDPTVPLTTHLPDVLNTMPSVNAQTGGINTNKISIRGIGSRSQFATSDVKLFFHDIPLHNSVGESSLEDYGFQLTDQIEVVGGVTPVDMEAGFGGAILLQKKYSESRLRSEWTMGRWGLLQSNNEWTMNTSKGGFSLGYNDLSSDGFRNHNKVRRKNSNLFISRDLGRSWNVFLVANTLQLEAEIPSSLNLEGYEQRPEQAAFIWEDSEGREDYERSLAGLTVKKNWKNDVHLSTTIFYQGFNSVEVRPFNVIEENSTLIGLKSRLSAKWKYLETTVGYRVQWDSYNFALFDNDLYDQEIAFASGEEDRIIAETFIDNNIDLGQGIILSADVNVQKPNFRRSGEQVLNPLLFLPSLGLRKVHAYYQSFIKVAKGINYFGLDAAVLPDGKINDNLLPSQAWDVTWGLAANDENKRWKGHLQIYQMWVDQLLVNELLENGATVFTNSGSATFRGLSLSLQTQWSLGPLTTHWSVNSNFNSNTFKKFIADGQSLEGNQIPGFPKHQHQGSLAFVYKNLCASIHYTHVGQMALNDENDGLYDGHQLVGLQLNYHHLLGEKWKILFNGGIHNVLNSPYASMIQVNAFGSSPRFYYPGNPFMPSLTLGIHYLFDGSTRSEGLH